MMAEEEVKTMTLARLICKVGSPAFLFFSGIGVSLATNIMVACITLSDASPVSGRYLVASSGLWLLSSFSAFVIGSKIAGFDANYTSSIPYPKLGARNDATGIGAEGPASPPVLTRSENLVHQFHYGVRFKCLWLFALLSGPTVGGILFVQARLSLVAKLIEQARSVGGH